MIARHDLVLGLCLCHCLYFFTSLPNLLILCVSLFFMPSLQLHLIFFSHWICLPPFFCHLFIVFLHLLPQHCLHPFRLPLFCLCVTHPPSLPCMHSLFLNLSLFHSLLLFFSVLTPSPSPLSLALSTPPFFSMFLFLSTSTTCATEGNIASSGPCWTITMQSNPNRDVCRKQHVCNYCLMRPLSQAECPIRLPMRKWCQGPVKKERKDGAKRSRQGDREVEVRRLQHGEKGVEDEKHGGKKGVRGTWETVKKERRWKERWRDWGERGKMKRKENERISAVYMWSNGRVDSIEPRINWHIKWESEELLRRAIKRSKRKELYIAVCGQPCWSTKWLTFLGSLSLFLVNIALQM